MWWLQDLGQTLRMAAHRVGWDWGGHTTHSCQENGNGKLWGEKDSGNNLLCELCRLLPTTMHRAGGVLAWPS